jgi:predicted RNA-binding protein
MYYIFIINNIEIGNKIIKAEEILDTLLNKKIWLFNTFSPNFKKIKKDDKILVYIAGKNRRYFVGGFTITGEMVKHENESPTNHVEKMLFNLFEYSINIEKIIMFTKPINILDIKERLHFIKDKKNYGLYFRLATKLIDQRDYEFIINQDKFNIEEVFV